MEFTNDWFQPNIPVWKSIIPAYHPKRILEVGSFEGQSICHLIQMLEDVDDLDIYCIDSWQGGREHSEMDMEEVENRFDRNIQSCIDSRTKKISYTKIKSNSLEALSSLIAQGRSEYFDMAYIDGSHEAPDVLSDCILAFKLLRVGGLMIIDDYLWRHGTNQNPLLSPKLGIDFFINCFYKKIQVRPWLPNYQLFCHKFEK